MFVTRLDENEQTATFGQPFRSKDLSTGGKVCGLVTRRKNVGGPCEVREERHHQYRKSPRF